MPLLFIFRGEYLLKFNNLEWRMDVKVAKMPYILQNQLKQESKRSDFRCLGSCLCDEFETLWSKMSSPPAWKFSEPLTITATFESYAISRTKLILILTLTDYYQCPQWVMSGWGRASICYDCSWKIPPSIPSPLSSNYRPFRGFRRRRQWQPTPVLLPGKSHGWRSRVGCSPWGRQGLDTTERLHFNFSLSCIGEGNGNLLQCSCLENPREPGGLPSMGSHRVRHYWRDLAAAAAAEALEHWQPIEILWGRRKSLWFD